MEERLHCPDLASFSRRSDIKELWVTMPQRLTNPTRMRVVSICTLGLLPFVPRTGITQERRVPGVGTLRLYDFGFWLIALIISQLSEIKSRRVVKAATLLYLLKPDIIIFPRCRKVHALPKAFGRW